MKGPVLPRTVILSAYTGLRKGEIGSLTLASLDLESSPPTVTVDAAYSKRRRARLGCLAHDARG